MEKEMGRALFPPDVEHAEVGPTPAGEPTRAEPDSAVIARLDAIMAALGIALESEEDK